MMRAVTFRTPAGGTVVLAGGILGLAEDGPDLERRLAAEPFDAVLLGIPFEDLDAIRATSGREAALEFARDETDEIYLRELARFGRVQVPPGDLYAAFRHAETHRLRVEAIDLGDEGHTAVYTEHVGMWELLRNNRRLRRLGKERFEAADAEAFAREWDRRLFPTKGLRRVQDEREAWMARRVAESAVIGSRVFVLVPLARWTGVGNRLEQESAFARTAD